MKMNKKGPDSVNSWLMAVICVFLSIIIYGVVRLSGVLFVASMSRFSVDRQRASMPYIFTDFVQAISSPLTGYLTHKYGVRLVMALGCLLSAVGIGACFFAEEIGTVTIFWGVVLGIGFGLSVPLLAIVITQHFLNKRAIAIGVVYFGSYVGFSTLPGIAEYLIDYYGLSGAFLWISGIMLHCVPLAMLLQRPNFLNDAPRTIDQEERTSLYEIEPRDIPEPFATKETQQEHPNELGGSISNKTEDSEQKDEQSYKYQTITETPETLPLNNSTADYDIVCKEEIVLNSSDPSDRKLNKKLDNSDPPTIQPKSSTSSIGAFKVFLEPVYIVVLMAEAVFEGSFIAFVTIIVDFSRDVGLPLMYGKYVILVFSLASSVGLLCFGWVTDNGYMTCTNFSGLLFVLRCVTTAIIPFSNGLAFLLVAVLLQGLCESPLSNLFPLIIADYYKKEVHEVAISCRLFLCAPVYLVTPTLIGYFRDHLGSYFYLFYLISLCSLISGILLFLAPQLAKYRCGRDERILRNKNL